MRHWRKFILDKPTPLAYIHFLKKPMNSVAETGAFKLKAKGRMSAADVHTVIDLLAADPLCGDLIRGTGGVRKVRIAVKGKGKSGGVRVVYYFYNETMPVFLITVFAKKEKDNLTKAQRNTLAKLVKMLRDSYGD